METDLSRFVIIRQYFAGTLSDAEMVEFEQELANLQEAQLEFGKAKLMADVIRRVAIREKLNAFQKEHFPEDAQAAEDHKRKSSA